MAQVSGTMSTYDVNPSYAQAGGGVNREDLLDEMMDISPTETPFVNLAGTRKAKAVQFEWPIDSLGDPSYSSTYVVQEGNDVTRVAPTPPSRAGNYCQINERNGCVTGTQLAVDTAGVSEMRAYQKAMSLKRLKNDIEKSAIRLEEAAGGGALVKGSDGSPLRRTRSFPHFVYTNNVTHGSWAQSNVETTEITDGTPANYSLLTEAAVVSGHQKAYQQGGNPSKLLVSTLNKVIVSGFTGRENSRQNIDETKASYNVTLYATPFGVLSIVPDRFMDDTFVVGIDPEYAQIAYLRRPASFPLAKTGDHETDVVNAEWGVQCGNEKAHFSITGLKTS